MTTIKITDELRKKLEGLKIIKRQPVNDVVQVLYDEHVKQTKKEKVR